MKKCRKQGSFSAVLSFSAFKACLSVLDQALYLCMVSGLLLAPAMLLVALGEYGSVQRERLPAGLNSDLHKKA